MNEKQKLEFAEMRLEAFLNTYPKKYVEDYAKNMYIHSDKSGEWVDDGAHGYLIVPPSHP